jgi:hypothetical protein
VKFAKAFALFWYDFIVGDSIVLAIGGVLIVALGYGLVEIDAAAIAEVVLPITAVATIFLSLPELRRG